MFFHQRQECYQWEDIVTIVFEWLLNGFAYSFAGSKMNNTNDIQILCEHIVHCYVVAAVNIKKVGTTAYYLLYTVQHIHIRVAQVVHYNHVVALLHQFYYRVWTYITDSSGH